MEQDKRTWSRVVVHDGMLMVEGNYGVGNAETAAPSRRAAEFALLQALIDKANEGDGEQAAHFARAMQILSDTHVSEPT